MQFGRYDPVFWILELPEPLTANHLHFHGRWVYLADNTERSCTDNGQDDHDQEGDGCPGDLQYRAAYNVRPIASLTFLAAEDD